jgi:hypothetical protein
MALVEIDATLTDLMKKLGCNFTLIEAVEAANLVCEYAMDGVTVMTTPSSPVKLPENGNLPYGQKAPIKLGSLQMILAGTLPGGAAKNVAKISLEKAVKVVLAHTTVDIDHPAFLKPSSDSFDPTKEISPKPVPNVDLQKIFSPKKVSEAVALAQENPNLSPDVKTLTEALEGMVVDQHKVKLSNATILYQPVAGSDAGSTYFCIATGDMLNVAVRIKGGAAGMKVSFRAEGPGVSNASVKKQMVLAGLTGSENHYSVHLAADSTELAMKSVGALLFGLGVSFKQVATQMNPIWNKGQ